MALSCPPNCIKGTPLWSLYDVTDTNPEFCLFESVVGEFTDISGFPVLYYRAKSNMDRLYGEDSNQDFYEPVQTKLYYEPTDEPNIIDMFGIRSDETLQYSLLPKSIFTRDVGGSINGIPATISNAVSGSNYNSGMKVPTTGGTGTGMYVDITTSSGGVTKIVINSFNKGFGYTVGDVITITGGDENATFTVASVTTADIGPMAGDVIKTLWNNRNYEIVDIGSEQSIFQGKKLVWEFILRPYRFSEQSDKAEEIHRSSVGYTQIYIYPDGLFADITYSNGTEVLKVDVTTLDVELDGLECGRSYLRNPDGSYDLLEPEIVQEDDIFPHPTYEDTQKPFETKPVLVYGDNEWVEIESNKIDDYGDIDGLMFAFSEAIPIKYGSSVDTTITQSDVDDFTLFNALDGESYHIEMNVVSSYLYIVIPVSFNDVVFTVNGLSVLFEESTANFLMDGDSYTCTVFKSQYQVNGNVVIEMMPEA